MKALSEYLLKLANDESEYNNYFQWKTELYVMMMISLRVLDMTAIIKNDVRMLCSK